MHTPEDNSQHANRAYLALAGFLVLQIVAYYLFSRYFS
jgi:hypothetical protein